jgi:hypothetical protein
MLHNLGSLWHASLVAIRAPKIFARATAIAYLPFRRPTGDDQHKQLTVVGARGAAPR